MARFLFILILTSLLLAWYLYSAFTGRPFGLFDRLRRKGFRAPKGPPTMFHVRELLVRQEKDKAIQLYCQIFNVGKKEAKKAVDELERSIQKKH